MVPKYKTPKNALDSILASNSAAKAAQLLGVHRTNIYQYTYRYDKNNVPPIIKRALIDKGYIKKRKRIRSQINWETEEQKQAFLDYIQKLGYHSVTEFARDAADFLLANITAVYWNGQMTSDNHLHELVELTETYAGFPAGLMGLCTADLPEDEVYAVYFPKEGWYTFRGIGVRNKFKVIKDFEYDPRQHS